MSAIENAVIETVQLLSGSKIPPWKVESHLQETYSLIPPENYRLSAKIRRRYLRERTGVDIKYLTLPEKPYLVNLECGVCSIPYQLAAFDNNRYCSVCGEELIEDKPQKTYPLTANYIGGIDDYFSYCGNFECHGDIEKEFTGILQYGTGLGPIGVTRGGFFIKRYGGADIKVTETARACRNLGYMFPDESSRKQALQLIEDFLYAVREEMNISLSKWRGNVQFIELLPVEDMGRIYLFIDFTAEFDLYRGHGAISKAAGIAKKMIDEKLGSAGIKFLQSGIIQGYDGDLKPSYRNKRGRYCLARLSIPESEFEKLTGKTSEDFLDIVRMDSKGAEKLGGLHHTGMGGEIIAGVYKAAKINPHAPLVSSTQKIICYGEGGNIIYGVEMPNIEAGTISSTEGAVPPLGREMMQVMGINSAREFAAYLTMLVLAGELNLSIEIARGNLYKAD
ncbi:MAG: hypothetical protein GF307_10860 [candidate division Zixibacteria bacterium]|nr:hypothetical protein [candidate division Zixibacteria bacterium]